MSNKVTPQDIKKRLYAEGITLKQWAEDNGYKPTQVYRVMRGENKALYGENKALYGEGHTIAVKLGLKPAHE